MGFDMTSAAVYPGYKLAYLHLKPKVNTTDKSRVVRIYKRGVNRNVAKLSDQFLEQDVRDNTTIKFTDLENDETYDVFIVEKDDLFADYPENYLTVIPENKHLLPIRSDNPANDIKSFFTLMYNLVTTIRDDIVLTRHGPTLDFGDAEDAVKQLTKAEVQQLQALEKVIAADEEFTAAQNTSYNALRNAVTRGDIPFVVYRLMERQLASGNIPFGNDKALAPRTVYSGLDPEIGAWVEEKMFLYDNNVELRVFCKDANTAEDLALFFEYIIEDYKDYFQRNGMHQVYFHSRNSDDFNQGRMDFYVRPLTFFVRTQRVIKQIPDVIRTIEATASLSPLVINANILIQGTDFS